MSFYRSREHINYTYCIQNNDLNLVSSTRDLGITLTHNLIFQEHIECIVKESYCVLELNKQLLLLLILNESQVGSQTKQKTNIEATHLNFQTFKT